MVPLIKQLIETALEVEIESHIAKYVLSGKSNRRNGFNKKTIKGTCDDNFELETPRDRNGTFEPQIFKKHQTTISYEIEEKIISTATIRAVTDKIITTVKEWQARPLEAIYQFIWLDAIHYKVKDGGKYVSKAVYTILSVRLDGKKEILGLYLSETEGTKFFLTESVSTKALCPY